MRISDWSSDVCSSDLLHARIVGARDRVAVGRAQLDIVHRRNVEVERRQPVLIMALEARELAVARRDDVEFILAHPVGGHRRRSEEHTSELQSLMRNSYAVFCLKKKKKIITTKITKPPQTT